MKKSIKLILIGSFFVLLLVLLIINSSIKTNFNFYINGSELVNQNVLDKYNDKGASAYIKTSIFTKDNLKVKTINEVDTSKIGTYYVTYKVKYNNKTYSKQRKVKVVDLINPVININKDVVNMCEGKIVDDFKYVALDNYDGNLTKDVTTKSTKKYYILSVKDSSGNVTNKKVDLINLDKEKPSILLNGEDTINLLVGDNYIELGSKAISKCDGDISSNIEIISNVDTSKKGEYKVIYKIVDRFNNSNEVIRKVVVS